MQYKYVRVILFTQVEDFLWYFRKVSTHQGKYRKAKYTAGRFLEVNTLTNDYKSNFTSFLLRSVNAEICT